MKVYNTSDLKQLFANILYYSLSGTGKTHSILTLDPNDTIVVQTERSVLPLKGKGYFALFAESWGDVQNIFRVLHRHSDGISTEEIGAAGNGDAGPIIPFPDGFKTDKKKRHFVVIDSLSEVNELCKAHILKVDRPTVMLAGDQELKGMYDDQLRIQDWGALATRMGSFISAMTKLPYHILMTAMETWTEDKQAGRLYQTPGLNGNLRLQVPKYFDYVFYSEVTANGDGKPSFQWQTTNDGQRLCKGAPEFDVVEPQDWKIIFNKIFGEKDDG